MTTNTNQIEGNKQPHKIIIKGGANELVLNSAFFNAATTPIELHMEGGKNKISFDAPAPTAQNDTLANNTAANDTTANTPEKTIAKKQDAPLVAAAAAAVPMTIAKDEQKIEAKKTPVAPITPTSSSHAASTPASSSSSRTGTSNNKWIKPAAIGAGALILASLFMKKCNDSNSTPINTDRDHHGVVVPAFSNDDLTIRFDHNSSTLSDSAKVTLDKIGRAMEHVTFHGQNIDTLKISGFASTPGTEDYNCDLSEERIAAAKTYLQGHYAVSLDSLTFVEEAAFGEYLPVYNADSTENEPASRRAILEIGQPG